LNNAIDIGLGLFHLGLGFQSFETGGTIGDRAAGLEGLAFGDFEIAHGTDGDGDHQAAGFWGGFDHGSWRGLAALGDRGFGAEGSCADQDSDKPGDD
jgi:hypothetical protein